MPVKKLSRQRLLHPVRTQQKRQFLRDHLRFESLELRALLTADVGQFEIGLAPAEPLELIEDDRAYYAELAASQSNGESNRNATLRPLDETFLLHSRPFATKTVFLDFDGFTARDTLWLNGDTIVSPPYDPDGDGPQFSDAELRRIQGVWHRVATDLTPFDVNVTTEDPGEAALVNTGGSDEHWGIRVVVTPDDSPSPGSGGVAYINSFDWGYNRPGATDTPTYVFTSSEVAVAGATSHEVGHTLGLSHDGTTDEHPTQPGQTYYRGHGSGETSWGPIMGSAGYYRNVTTWDDGNYFGTSNSGSGANYNRGAGDIPIIVDGNGFGFVPDPDGDTIESATQLEAVPDFDDGLADIFNYSVIHKNDDIDVFSFQTGAGQLNLSINPYVNDVYTRVSPDEFEQNYESSFFNDSQWSQNQGANLDVEAILFDEDGVEIARSNPTGLRASFENLPIDAGTYYLQIDGVGFGTPAANPPIGYNDYGSIGQYQISGTVPVAMGLDIANSELLFVEDSAGQIIVDQVDFIDGVPGSYNATLLDVAIEPNPADSDQISFDPGSVGLELQGNQIIEDGQAVANMTRFSETSIQFAFTENADKEALLKVTRGLAFAASGDAPSTSDRRIALTVEKSGFTATSYVDVTVQTINDAPTQGEIFLPSVLEDATEGVGQSIGEAFDNQFSDPDAFGFLSGVAIVGNQSTADQGVWQYSVDFGSNWIDVEFVNDETAGLVLSRNDSIRFAPGPDFNGEPGALVVRAIDDSYTGEFSSANRAVFIDGSLRGGISPVAANPSFSRILVSPVNDAPIANETQLDFSATQDERLLAPLPEGTFTDIDDSSLTYSINSLDGSDLPTWLRIDQTTGELSGIPDKYDVFDLGLQLTAQDAAGESATLPVFIEVLNVNDPPEDVQFTPLPILENLDEATVGLLRAFDADGDVIQWSVEDNRFYVDGNQIKVRGGVQIDFESEPIISTTVTATDTGSPAFSQQIDVEFIIEDANEFTPQLDNEYFEIERTIGGGETIAQLTATDGDINQTITYSLTLDSSPLFQIDADSGKLSVGDNVILNDSNNEEFRLFVRATDSGTPERSRVVTIDVALIDPTVVSLTTDSQRVPIRRNGFSLGGLRGVDQNGSTDYSFSVSDERFEIVDGNFQLRSDVALLPSDAPGISVPITVTSSSSGEEIGQFELDIAVFDPAPWQNYFNPLDVDRDGDIRPRDALLIINDLNKRSTRQLPETRLNDQLNQPDIDVSGDNFLQPIDALLVINYLNRLGAGEGEPNTDTPTSDAPTEGDSQYAAWSAAWNDLERERKLGLGI